MEHINEILALKVKVMLQKIDKLRNIYIMIFQESDREEINCLEMIKEQYLRMYDELIKKGEYEKYREIEDIVIKEIAKVELRLDEYIYDTAKNYQEIMAGYIQRIRESKNYENFQNMSEELNKIETLSDLLKLYGPYISKNEEKRIQDEIIRLKFEILFRKQVEELIYKNGGLSNNLKQYKNEVERKVFKQLLDEKINSIRYTNDEQIKDDEVFHASTEQILNDTRLLERLIIIDMKKNPYNYINLLNAKIFNAHLCNIGNNPFEQEVYLTEEQIKALGFWRYVYIHESKHEGLKTNKVNYSLLCAILQNIITNEDVSILDCENLYKKFGFECSYISLNMAQKCVKMILDDVKGSQEFEIFLQSLKKENESSEINYCEITLLGLKYEFNNEEKEPEDLLNQILSKREPKKVLDNKTSKRSLFSQKKIEIIEEKDQLQEEKERIKKQGIATTDINIIILLVKDLIDYYNTEIQRLNKREYEGSLDKYLIKSYEKYINEANDKIKWLEELKSKQDELSLGETKELLFTIGNVYGTLHIKYNPRRIYPLESMNRSSHKQVYIAPIPEERGTYSVEVSHSFAHGSTYRSMPYHNSDAKPLWRKYKKEFEDLGIDVRKHDKYFYNSAYFPICINLKDISDLPIDYKNLKLLTKEKLEEVMKREEENEKE